MTDTPLAAAISAVYSLGPILRCSVVRRTANDLVQIESSSGTFWLKLASRTVRTSEELEAEAEVVACLAAAGVSVAEPVRRADGHYAGAVDLPHLRAMGVMSRAAQGTEVTAPSEAQALELGIQLGKLHLAKTCAHPNRWTIDATSLCNAPLAWLAARQKSWVLDEVASIGAEMIEQVWGAPTNALPFGICHGDLHLENVRFDGTAPTLIDFESCGSGPVVYDLACYWRKRVGLMRAPAHEWEALTAGYQTVRPLTPIERRCIPALATLRAIWTMALPASPMSRWGRDWLDDEYFESHLGMVKQLATAARTFH